VNDPDTIEVGGHVEPGTRFFVGFEEDFLPFDLTEFEESLTWGDVDKTGLVLQNDSFDSLRIPEQLIYIVVSDDLVVISFASDVFAIVNLVALIAHVLIERGNDIVEIIPFLERFVARLTFRRAKIIVATFEDEGKTFRNKTNLIGLTPTTQIQRKLPCTIMLRHLIHLCLPTILGGFKTIVALQFFKCTFIDLSLTGFLGSCSCLASTFIGMSAEFDVGETD